MLNHSQPSMNPPDSSTEGDPTTPATAGGPFPLGLRASGLIFPSVMEARHD